MNNTIKDKKKIKKLAEKIWDYHRLNHKLKKADLILVLGSHDTRVAERGAKLFLAGAGSGNNGYFSANILCRLSGKNGFNTFDRVVNIMVGDLQRIKIYPQKGFQILQEIPQDVWQAGGELIKLGYDEHLVK